MSMRRDEVASTSILRHFGTICPIGSNLSKNGQLCIYTVKGPRKYDLAIYQNNT